MNEEQSVDAGEAMKTRRKGRKLRRRHRPPKNEMEKFVAKDLYIAMQYEFRASLDNQRDLKRVVLVNWDRQVILDVKVVLNDSRKNKRSPRLSVTNTIAASLSLAELRWRIQSITEGNVLIGYSLDYALYALDLQIPWVNLRDSATYTPFMKEVNDPLTVMLVPRSLAELGEIFGCRSCKNSETSLIQQALCCMDLYRRKRVEWEEDVAKLIRQKERQREIAEHHKQMRMLTMIPEQDLSEENHIHSATEESQRLPDDAYEAYRGLRSLSIDATLREELQTKEGRLGGDSLQTDWVGTHRALAMLAPDLSQPDDLSWSSSAFSSANIWMPSVDSLSSVPSNISQDRWSGAENSAYHARGLWLMRPEKESTHPVEIGDWLDERENQVLDEDMHEVNLIDEDDVASGHLPSKLLSDSDDSGKEAPVREDSSHLVDGVDWLEEGKKPPSHRTKDNWFRRRPSDFRPPQDSNQHHLSEVTPLTAGKIPSSPKFGFFRRKSESDDTRKIHLQGT